MGQVGMEWTVAGFGDFSGNANETDMLIRDSNTGVFEVFDIRNYTIASAAAMGQVGLSSSVSGIANDPPGAAAASMTQFTMASFAPASGALDTSAPLAGAASPPGSATLFAAPAPRT